MRHIDEEIEELRMDIFGMIHNEEEEGEEGEEERKITYDRSLPGAHSVSDVIIGSHDWSQEEITTVKKIRHFKRVFIPILIFSD